MMFRIEQVPVHLARGRPGAAPGGADSAARYNPLSRAINNKPSQCDARVEQEEICCNVTSNCGTDLAWVVPGPESFRMQVTPVPVDVPRPGRTKSRHSVQLEGLVVSELVGQCHCHGARCCASDS